MGIEPVPDTAELVWGIAPLVLWIALMGGVALLGEPHLAHGQTA